MLRGLFSIYQYIRRWLHEVTCRLQSEKVVFISVILIDNVNKADPTIIKPCHYLIRTFK